MGFIKDCLGAGAWHCALFSLLLAMLLAAAPAGAEGDELQVDADSMEILPDSGDGTAIGNVRVKYQDMVLRADRVRLNRQTKDFDASGNVEVHKGKDAWLAERVTGNFGTGVFSTGENQAHLDPWFANATAVTRRTDGTTEFRGVSLSTCEHLHDFNEHYSLEARRVVYYPDGSFRAYNIIVKFRGIPVFYLPMLASGSERGNLGGLSLSAGHDSRAGAYLFVEQDFRLTESLSTKMLVHLRSKSGVALGNLTTLKTDKTDTELFVYGMRDSNPPETAPGFNRRFESEDNRYRVRLKHRTDFTDSLTLRLQADAFSDIEMLEDWFRKEHREDPQPASFLNLTWAGERVHAAIHASPRLNDFFTVTEQLPEIRADLPRQRLGGSAFLYQGETSLSRLQTRWRNFDLPRPPGLTDPRDYSALRLDSLHMFYRPMQFAGNRIQFIPRAGLRVTTAAAATRR